MSPTTPSPDSSRKADSANNRRVHMRFPCRRSTAGHFAMVEPCVFQPVRVLDLSAGGMALLLWEPVEQGVEVFVQLTNRERDLTCELPARVANITQMSSGTWAVGIIFAQPLKEDELEQFI